MTVDAGSEVTRQARGEVTSALRLARAWAVLATVPDPEVPALSICDLGIVRDVVERDGGLEVVLTPTYSGCPAIEAIQHDALAALEHAGLGPASARLVRAPAWTSDWISADGRRKLREAGIAPPGLAFGGTAPIRIFGRMAPPLACPRCASSATERISAFGSTACKSLYRCRDCGEPFEHFKAI